MFARFRMVSQFKIPLLFLGTAALAQIPIFACMFAVQLAVLSGHTIAWTAGALTALSLVLHLRHKTLFGVVVGSIGVAVLIGHLTGNWVYITETIIAAFMLQAGVSDYFQEVHSLERSFPVFAHIRRGAELIRDEIRQYFIEGDTEGKPVPRTDRSLVYQLAKNEPSDISLGTKQDYAKSGQIHIGNSMYPVPDTEPLTLAPLILGSNRHIRKPAKLWGRFGIGDMSFGALGPNAVMALSSGARYGLKDSITDTVFDENTPVGMISTGEGALTEYHRNGVHINMTAAKRIGWAAAYGLSYVSSRYRREPMPRTGHIGGARIMAEAGTGMFGFRTPDGHFSFDLYAEIMADDQIDAYKIKIAQGAKPGGGALLPGAKVTAEIARIRGIPQGRDCVSPNTWGEFHNLEEMMAFIDKLQEISGKPVGIKMVVGKKADIEAMAKWMAEHPGQGPDFIHIDGGEGGSGAAPLMLADYAGMSILNALPLVDNVLRQHGVRDRVILMSSGKVFNPAQLFIHLALGADYVFGARGFMFSLGCIQATKCATGECPVGVATHHPWLQRALVPKVKYVRVANYMHAMHKHLIKLLRVAGVRDTFELNRSHLLFVRENEEVEGQLVYPYPQGHDQPRTPPVNMPEIAQPAPVAVTTEAIATQADPATA